VWCLHASHSIDFRFALLVHFADARPVRKRTRTCHTTNALICSSPTGSFHRFRLSLRLVEQPASAARQEDEAVTRGLGEGDRKRGSTRTASITDWCCYAASLSSVGVPQLQSLLLLRRVSLSLQLWCHNEPHLNRCSIDRHKSQSTTTTTRESD
jgi:hypothetical protein